MIIRPLTAAYLVAGLTIVTGCRAGNGADSGSDSVVRDSAGSEIVRSVAPLWTDENEWRISSDPVLSIGEAASSPEYRFFRVSDILRMSNGRIVVVNRGTFELRLFSSDGRYLYTVGGKGNGPGEFQGRITAELAGDSLLVFDPARNRLSILDRNGNFLSSTRLAPTGDPVRPLRMYGLAGVIPGRGLLLLPNAFPANMRPEPVAYWDSLANLLYAFDGTLLDTLGGFSGMDMFSTPRHSGSLRFGSVTAADVHEGYLYIGHGHEYEVEVYEPDGSLVRLIRRRAVPIRGEEVVERLVEWMEGRAERMGAPPGALAEFRQEIATEPFAETLPFYDDLVVDAAVNIWVQRHRPRWEQGPVDWDVFNSDGYWLGTVALPGGFAPHEIGHDYLLGVSKDEFGVEYVHMYRLVK